MATSEREYDVYKDTPLRLLGYANEVGEAFRGFIGRKMVLVTYGIAHLYVFADTYDKAKKAYKKDKDKPGCIKRTAFAATDTLIWQVLASVYFPGFTINRVCALTNHMLKKNAKLETNKRKLIVTLVGLAVIPFIIRPIDEFTHYLLDSSLRKLAPVKQ